MHRTKDLCTAGDEVNITDFVGQVASSHHISYTIMELETATTVTMTVWNARELTARTKVDFDYFLRWFKSNAD